MHLSWWYWLLLGFGLLLLELITPGGFFVFFFGVGAIIVGLLASVGLSGSPELQWLLFGIVSVAGVLFLRKPLQRRTQVNPDREVDSIVGEIAVATGEIGIQQIGKVELRGTQWTACNIGDSIINAAQRCRVERVEGLTLHIRA
jgi:membrane protein implicated in regulation of membrane protease activity